MRCPRCQQENPPRAKFCLECAAPLTLRCSNCGTELPASAKFCLECSHPVSAVPLARPGLTSPQSYTPTHLAEKILTSKASLEGERKQVTVLFADLKGSMELLADRDPEEAREILDPVLERMMEAVHRYEGTVNQVMGDGIMALFGAPLAHEDHAVRACYAALRMQENVKKYADEVRRSHAAVVKIRVGLNSGAVVVRTIGSDLNMDYTAVGQTTHLAARMEQIADPGAIVITPDTLALAEGYVEVKSLGHVRVKGLGEAMEVYEITGTGLARTRLQASARRGLTRFVGRNAELEQLRRAQQLAGEGRGQIAAIVGEAGVGKSRLVYELTHSHRLRGWLTLESASVSYGKATSWLPVIELLKSYFKIHDRNDHREIREKVTGKLITLDRALEPTVPALLALLEVPVEDASWDALDPGQRRKRTLDAVKRLLLREAREQPLLLIFEDLHWIDNETQAFLDELVESLGSARLMLLVNYRPEYQHVWGSKSAYSQMRLDALPAESAAELMEALLGDDQSLAPLKRLLVKRGNPFFLEETIRTLIEMQALVGERGRYRLTKPIQSVEVPATVQAILAARIDRLGPEDKRLLQVASVIGKDMPFALLQATADLTDEALRSGLHRLQAAEFVYEAGLYPDIEYTFKHALTHEVTYSGLLQERRRFLHECTAQAIESLYRDRLEERCVELAHHYSRSGNAAKAVRYLERSGQQALQRSAYADAIAHLTKSLELLPTLPDTAERAERELMSNLALGASLVATKGWAAAEVEGVYARARQLCPRVGESDQQFSALWGLQSFYIVRAEHRVARELGRALEGLAQRRPEPYILVGAHHGMANTAYCAGEWTLAREHFEQSFCHYDRQQHRTHIALFGMDLGVFGLAYLPHVLWHLGYPDQALAKSRDAIALARELSHPFSLAAALDYAAMLAQFRRESHAAYEWADAAVALCEEQGLAYYLAWATIIRGWALVERNQAEEGIAQMHQGLAALRGTGAEVRLPYYLALLADAYGKTGHPAKGLTLLAEAFEQAQRKGESWRDAELHRLKGELLLADGAQQGAQAEACFHQALEVARRQNTKALELRTVVSLSRLWQQQGRQGAIGEHLAPVYDWFTEGFDTADLQAAKVLRAVKE